ncbi:hypothetical protein EC845_3073 [Comamonas sp. BIGb0124]|nr:hypothetical protein EC845_3073 [Comamonas sp. BIGb0124]
MFAKGLLGRPPRAPADVPRFRVLVLGIYLTDRVNQASQLVVDFAKSQHHDVDQKWVALGATPPTSDPGLKAVTVRHCRQLIPKFKLLNEMLAGLEVDDYDYIIFTDDDVALCPDFVDAYLAWVASCGFSISQPARTRFSYRDHKFCLRTWGVKARETLFVEIGPVFVFDRAAARHLLPFDERSPMGWGIDFVWPKKTRELNMTMGIIDAVTVDHSYREQGKTYSSSDNRIIMDEFLRDVEHLKPEEARVSIRIYR